MPNFLNTIVENAAKIGMKVNKNRTQLLCTSTAINYDVRSYVRVGGEKWVSGDTLKTVGWLCVRKETRSCRTNKKDEMSIRGHSAI